MRSTGGQPARLYGLAKVHRNTPLRPVLSLPGSSYYNLNKVLAKFFEKIEGANIETNSLDAREILESTNLEPNENLISLDVKSLYTNVPLKEAIDIALRKLYEQDEPPSIARKTMKRLLNMAVQPDISLRFSLKLCDIRPEWPKCNLCRLRVFSSEPSGLVVITN